MPLQFDFLDANYDNPEVIRIKARCLNTDVTAKLCNCKFEHPHNVPRIKCPKCGAVAPLRSAHSAWAKQKILPGDF